MYSNIHHRNLLKSCLIIAALGSAVVCAKQAPSAKGDASVIQRGLYLVNVGGCSDCHTPKLLTPDGPVPDKTRLLSGHPSNAKLPPAPSGVIGPDQWGAVTTNDLTAWVGPWGMSFAANLTPDATGLGSWTPEIFIKAMRNGKIAGVGRPILPPMPWMDYAQMTDADLRAVFAYLKSLPPISNVVPAPLPPATGTASGQ